MCAQRSNHIHSRISETPACRNNSIKLIEVGETRVHAFGVIALCAQLDESPDMSFTQSQHRGSCFSFVISSHVDRKPQMLTQTHPLLQLHRHKPQGFQSIGLPLLKLEV